MRATYHTHSTWSDGRASVAEMVAAAAAQSIDEIGVSDHFTLGPAGRRPKWSMDVDRLADYAEEILQLDDGRSGGPAVRLGLEADWFPGPEHERDLAARIENIPFDYVLGSVHYVDGFPIDGNPNRWRNLDQDKVDSIHEVYWRGVKQMAESGMYDVAAHLDLPKKFGRMPSASVTSLIDEALDALASAGMAVELNTAGWSKPCADAYPSLDILKRCRARAIPLTISSDAHRPEDLLRDFDRGVSRLREAGYDEVARFRLREVWLEPLERALEPAGA